MSRNRLPAAMGLVVGLLIIAGPVRAASRLEGRRHNYAVGAKLLYSKRTGYFVLDAAEARVDTARPDAIIGELALAKRYPVLKWLRFELGGGLGLGMVTEDTVRLGSTYYIEKKSFVHLGLEGDFHILFGSPERLRQYLILGGGVDLFRFQELFYDLEPPGQQVRFDKAAEGWRLAPNFQGGFGIDIPLKPNLGIGMSYTFRYWRPIRYEYQRDMPLETVPYWEQFLTHAFRVYVAFTVREEE
jgi:hypothetical protein